MKVFIISDLASYALAHSYMRALQKLRIAHIAFDVADATRKHVRLGRFGQELHRFLPLEAWMRKGNRELSLACVRYAPDLVIVFGNAPVLFGTVALIRASTAAKTVLYWPDPLFNLSSIQANAAPLYDCVATYSKATTGVFRDMGFRDALWVPFAADEDFLGSSAATAPEFEYDVSFAGGWRPEREATLGAVKRHFPKARLAIFGRSWFRSCKDKALLGSCVPKELYGPDYGNLIRRSRMTVNQIDNTNYPGANMRFFEVPAAGGLQVSSACPEMEPDLRDREHILYFDGERMLLEKVDWALARPQEAAEVRRAGHAAVLERHTYRQRIADLTRHLNLSP